MRLEKSKTLKQDNKDKTTGHDGHINSTMASQTNYVTNPKQKQPNRSRPQSLDISNYQKKYLEGKSKENSNFMENVLLEFDTKSPTVRSPQASNQSRKKWTMLRSVVKAVALFRMNEAEIINNETDLEKAIESCQLKKEPHFPPSNEKEEYEAHFKEERFYDLIAKGSLEDIKEIEEILYNNKRNYLHDPTDERSLLNAPNGLGITPLYIASQNGSLPMIKYLISKGANPLIASKVSLDIEETNLLVAARWKHLKITEFYLSSCKWSIKDLRKAKDAAGNSIIKETINIYIKRKSKCFCF